jgi:hypothetical protein
MKNQKIPVKKFLPIVSLAVVLLFFGAVGVKLLRQSHAATGAATVANTSVTPIYRFFRYAGGHFYTASRQERDFVRSTNTGYKYEGVAFYAYTTQVPGASPVYRLFDLLKGYHFYTISYAEYQQVAAMKQYYRDEGIAYYAKPTTGQGLTPVYRLYDYRQGIHFYTINAQEKDNLSLNVSNIYRYEGIAYYLPDANGNPGANSLYFSSALGAYTTGTTFSVTLRSLTSTPTNAVQATINYDPTMLQYVSMQNSSAFPLDAANSTTSGQIRIGRGTNSGTTVSGDQPVVTLTFKMLSSTSQGTLTFDPNFSFIANSSTNADMLNFVANGDYFVD